MYVNFLELWDSHGCTLPPGISVNSAAEHATICF
jgi:hypothetical protein